MSKKKNKKKTSKKKVSGKLKAKTRVKWKIGVAEDYSRGKVLRLIKAGTKLKNIPKLVSKMEVGQEFHADTYVVDADDGTRRLVRPGYLKPY